MARSSSEWLGVLGRPPLGVARSSSELLGSAPSSELQALLSPYKSAACWQETPLLRSSKVQNSELWLQMAPASGLCGELGLPSLERWREADLEARVLPRPLCKAHVHAADGFGHLC